MMSPLPKTREAIIKQAQEFVSLSNEKDKINNHLTALLIEVLVDIRDNLEPQYIDTEVLLEDNDSEDEFLG